MDTKRPPSLPALPAPSLAGAAGNISLHGRESNPKQAAGGRAVNGVLGLAREEGG